MRFEGQDRVVVVNRIVVKQCESSGSRCHRDIRCILNRAVAPPELGLILLFAVLRIVNDKIRIFEKLNMPLIARVFELRPGVVPIGFVIRNVGDGRAAIGDSVGDCGCRVIQILSLDQNVPDAEETLFQFGEVNAAG